MKRTAICSAFLFMLMATICHAQEKTLIAAASDLKFALDSAIAAFRQINKGSINVTYGSSGKLCEQIINGAPFDIFFSADIAYPEKLKIEKQSASEIYAYAKGRIVIWSKRKDPGSNGMKSLLDSDIKKIAMANPAHAPYGKRALESMTYYKIIEAAKAKLVYGENISQTAQFISTGAADIGIIALSLALSPNMKSQQGKYFLIPEESHQALIQGVVMTKHGENNKLAQAFFDFVKSDKAVRILKYYGFSVP